MMKYISTRDTDLYPRSVTSAEAIKEGLAPDGGLYIPLVFPRISAGDFDALIHMNYPERAALVLSRFLDDYDLDELYEDCAEAYSEARFPGRAPRPCTSCRTTYIRSSCGTVRRVLSRIWLSSSCRDFSHAR